MFPLNPPVSCSLSSLALQTRQLSNYDIRIFKHALGIKGSFPLCKNCDGHNSYISSLRKGNTRASTFPNAGPSTQSQLSFLRQRHNDFDGMFVVPKLQDSIDGVKFRHFHVIPRAQYILFKNRHKQGITTMNGIHNHVAYVDSQVSLYYLFCHFTTTYQISLNRSWFNISLKCCMLNRLIRSVLLHSSCYV